MKKPASIDDKTLSAVDHEWRTAREIFGLVDEGASISVAMALNRLVTVGKVNRRYDPHNNNLNGKIARYRRPSNGDQ